MVLRKVMEKMQAVPRPDVWMKEKVCSLADYYSSFKNPEEVEISHIERTEIRCCPSLLADCGLCCGVVKKGLPKCESPMPIRVIYMMVALFSLVGVLVIPFVVSTRGFGQNQACSNGLFYHSYDRNRPCPWHIVEVEAKYELDDKLLILVNLLQLAVCLIAFIFFACKYEHKIHWISMLIMILATGKFIMSGIYGGYMLHTKQSFHTYDLMQQVTDQLIRNPNLISQSLMEDRRCCGVESYKDYTRANMTIPTMCLCNCTQQEEYDLNKTRYEKDLDKRYDNYERYKRYTFLKAEKWVTEGRTTDRESSKYNSEEMVTKPPYFKSKSEMPHYILGYDSKAEKWVYEWVTTDRESSKYNSEEMVTKPLYFNSTTEKVPKPLYFHSTTEMLHRIMANDSESYHYWHHRPSCESHDSYRTCYDPIKIDGGLTVNNNLNGCWSALKDDFTSKVFANEEIKWITVLVTTGLQFILCLLTCCLKSSVRIKKVDGKSYGLGVEYM